MVDRKGHRILVRGVVLGVMAATRLWGGAITISVVPAGQGASIGSPVNIALRVAGLGDGAAPSLGTFDLNLTFDSTVLALSQTAFGDAVLGDQLDPTGLGNTITSAIEGIGTVELFDLSLDNASDLDDLQFSTFVLVRITFNAIGVGISSVNLILNALGDANGETLDAALLNGTASVSGPSAVPEPSTGLLLGFGLCLLALARRSKADRVI